MFDGYDDCNDSKEDATVLPWLASSVHRMAILLRLESDAFGRDYTRFVTLVFYTKT